MKSLIFVAALLASSVGMACSSENICAGDRVMDSSNNLGNVVEAFSNGKVMVKLDGFDATYVRQAETLSKALRCNIKSSTNNNLSLCANTRVVDSSGNLGIVVEVFDNGKAVVELDGFFARYVRTTSSLAKAQECNSHICVKDRVIDPSGNLGTVLEVFSNGKSFVRLDGFNASYIRATNTLGKGFRCIENICRGDRIIDASNNTGSIEEMFDNGKASVRLDGFNASYIRSYNSLGLQINCETKQNCACRN